MPPQHASKAYVCSQNTISFIVENSDKFMWFGHMWNHIQPHLYWNTTQLTLDMLRNKEFAKVVTTFPLHFAVDFSFNIWEMLTNLYLFGT